MNNMFYKGDIVYHWKYGKGVAGDCKQGTLYVKFDSDEDEGSRFVTNDEELSFTPYTLEKGGFSRERPKAEFKAGDFVKNDKGLIVLVTGIVNDILFAGIVISKGETLLAVGHLSNFWYSSTFIKIEIEIKE